MSIKQYWLWLIISLSIISPSCGGGPTILNAASPSSATQTGAQRTSSDPVAEVDIYVAPGGNDNAGKGTQTSPYQTIGRALLDVPPAVTQHYVINLGAGTYYEEVHIGGRYFGGNMAGNFNEDSIELKGDPSNPDAYIISGATPGAPTVPVRDNCVLNAGGNLILNGISLQYAKAAGLWQNAGVTLTNNIALRHHTTSGAYAMKVYDGMAVTRGTFTVDDVYNGLMADHKAIISGTYNQEITPDKFGGLQRGPWTITGVTGGIGLTAYVMSEIDSYGPATLTGTGATGSIGIAAGLWSDIWWDGGPIGSFDILVYADTGGLVTGVAFALQNANIGIDIQSGGRFENWPGESATFTNVTTPRLVAQGGMIYESSGNYFDGNLTSLGAVSISAGGTNQNVTLTPTGSGGIVLNGVVGVGGPSDGAKLKISSPGGDQTYLDVADSNANKDTLINLNAIGAPDETFFLRARSNGADKWWVKSDGSTFSTSLSTGINEVPFSSDPVFDASLGNNQVVTLTGDIVSSTLLNASSGQTLTFLVCQDATGHHKFNWPPNIRGGVNIGAMDPFGNATAAAPNTCTAQQFLVVGVNAFAVGPPSINM